MILTIERPLGLIHLLLSIILIHIHHVSAGPNHQHASPEPDPETEPEPDPPAKTITITAAPSIPSKSPEFISSEAFTSAILNSTNFFRTTHNATPVTYNDTLAKFATDFLHIQNPSCEFRHSDGPYGENIALGCSDAQSCVDAWGNERDIFDFGNPGFDKTTGHFTQLVWKNTTDVGCGRRLCGERGWFLACEYWPRGNVVGRFEAEVQAASGAGGRRVGEEWVMSVMMLWVGLTVVFWI